MPAEDDFNMFSELAERMGLEDEERENYITQHMKRLGYKMRTAWDEPESGDGNKNELGFFKEKTRERRTIEPRQRRASGGNDGGFYR